jgi:hypothetical protein
MCLVGTHIGAVRRELNEHLKWEVFRRLNQLARSKQIAVIFQHYDQDDAASSEYLRRYVSNWPTGRLDVCLFCGAAVKRAPRHVRMGSFAAHPWCEEDAIFVTEVKIRKGTDYRPDVIIVPIWFPGSLGNAILDLAWGLVAHELSFGNILTPARLEKEARIEAARLVRVIETQVTSTEGI